MSTTESYNGRHSQEDQPIEDQLAIPLEIFDESTVSWLHAMIVERKRFLLPNKTSVKLSYNQQTRMIDQTTVNVADIANIADPDLRYALRFAAAADSMGPIPRGHGFTQHFVQILATNEGPASTLISARYSGISNAQTDVFMDDIRSFDPRLSETEIN